MPTPELRIRSWVRGTDQDARDGLLGYLSLDYGPLILDSLTVRRTTEGRITLSFPERRDRTGRRHPIAHSPCPSSSTTHSHTLHPGYTPKAFRQPGDVLLECSPRHCTGHGLASHAPLNFICAQAVTSSIDTRVASAVTVAPLGSERV